MFRWSRDMDPKEFASAVADAGSYREALTELGRPYGSGPIVALQKFARAHGVDIFHLTKRGKDPGTRQRKHDAKVRRSSRRVNKERAGDPEDYVKFVLYDSRRNDRIGNTLGHTTDNMVVACFRCNMLRGTLPYQVWLHIVPAVRPAREAGLFGGWLPFRRTTRTTRIQE